MADKKSIKILVVDDDKDLCDSLVELFNLTGMNIRGVYSAIDALKIIDNEEIGIVISDIRMPGKDGFYLLNEIKKKKTDFPKVIFISGESVDLETCYKLGVDGFFEKPFNFEEVKKTVTKCLLQKSDLLKYPANNSKGRITKRFYDWNECLLSNQVGIGRSGLFLSEDRLSFEVGDVCDFSIQFVSGAPLKKFFGQGIVRWIRKPGENNLPPGVGVEIIHIEKKSMSFYLGQLELLDSVSTIPSCAQNNSKKMPDEVR